MRNRIGRILLAGAFAATLVACGEESADTSLQSFQSGEAETLAQAIGEAPSLSIAATAFEQTGLAGVLEGEASYTVLVPTNEAFGRLDAEAAGVFEDGQNGAIAAAILRSHMIPGALDLEAIEEAIEEAVSRETGQAAMTNFAGEVLTFRREGETLVIANGAGQRAEIAGPAIRAGKDALIPIETVLADPSQIPSQ